MIVALNLPRRVRKNGGPERMEEADYQRQRKQRAELIEFMRSRINSKSPKGDA